MANGVAGKRYTPAGALALDPREGRSSGRSGSGLAPARHRPTISTVRSGGSHATKTRASNTWWQISRSTDVVPIKSGSQNNVASGSAPWRDEKR
jgi:hypothetical protein